MVYVWAYLAVGVLLVGYRHLSVWVHGDTDESQVERVGSDYNFSRHQKDQAISIMKNPVLLAVMTIVAVAVWPIIIPDFVRSLCYK